mmetsp:Transcript_30472/g.81973  ORF Transcript_30472/g.81973 Transcript_30472/m.81973 type:complete len:277 (-) Transcript_30472:471-1301(-)
MQYTASNRTSQPQNLVCTVSHEATANRRARRAIGIAEAGAASDPTPVVPAAPESRACGMGSVREGCARARTARPRRPPLHHCASREYRGTRLALARRGRRGCQESQACGVRCCCHLLLNEGLCRAHDTTPMCARGRGRDPMRRIIVCVLHPGAHRGTKGAGTQVAPKSSAQVQSCPVSRSSEIVRSEGLARELEEILVLFPALEHCALVWVILLSVGLGVGHGPRLHVRDLELGAPAREYGGRECRALARRLSRVKSLVEPKSKVAVLASESTAVR